MLRRLIGTPAFRMAAIIGTGYLVLTALLLLFMYWQVAIGEIRRVDHLLERDAAILAEDPPAVLDQAVTRRLAADFHRIVLAALFDRDGGPLLGNLAQLPPGTPADGLAHAANGASPASPEALRMVLRRLPDGRLLAIGRNVDSLRELRHAVVRALAWGSLSGLMLSLVVGGLTGWRAQQQLRAMQQSVTRIIEGNLQERLPVTGRSGDQLNQLVGSVNRMLDDMVQDIIELENTNQNIAHDLRTPLTHVRLRLEQAYLGAQSYAELKDMVERAIAGLDHALVVISALLRIGQIDRGQIRHQFHDFVVAEALEEIIDLYAPLAEDKMIDLAVTVDKTLLVHGDRPLVQEAIANVLDNALKFSPAGGRVAVEAILRGGRPVIRITDNGPGISAEDRHRVTRPAYRGPQTANIPGNGLGLTLVDSIARLHGFQLVIGDAACGCRIELICSATKNY